MSETSANNARLGEILLAKKWVDQQTLSRALERQKTERHFLGTILLEDRRITEEQLATGLSEQFQIPYLKIKNFYIDWKLVMKFSPSLILDSGCFPLKKVDRTITFGITNPLDGFVRMQIEEESKSFGLELVFLTYSDMKELRERFRQYVNIQTRKLLD